LYYGTVYLLIVLLLAVFPLIPPQKLWDGLTAGPLAQSEVSQIASGNVPESRYVDIAGIPRFDWGGSSGVETLRSPVLVRALFPLVEPGWTSGETIFVFVDTYATNISDIQAAYRPENDYQASGGFNSRQRLDHDATGRAMVRLRGLLREDGLSSLMKEELHAAGLKIANPYYVLDHTLSPEDTWYLLRLIVLISIGGLVVPFLVGAFLAGGAGK